MRQNLNIKKQSIYILILFLLISCKTKEIIEEKKGFRYKVPPGMREAPEEAYKYKFNNLIIEENTDTRNSNVIIALRFVNIDEKTTLKEFVENDQYYLNLQYNITYDNNWTPSGFNKKNIEYISFQFSYQYGDNTIYQRSVYIKYQDMVYVISMSSKYYNILINHKNNYFWENIEID